jgi:hypothetical protein
MEQLLSLDEVRTRIQPRELWQVRHRDGFPAPALRRRGKDYWCPHRVADWLEQHPAPERQAAEHA